MRVRAHALAVRARHPLCRPRDARSPVVRVCRRADACAALAALLPCRFRCHAPAPPLQHTALLYALVDGYSAPDLALHCGTLLRECIKVRD